MIQTLVHTHDTGEWNQSVGGLHTDDATPAWRQSDWTSRVSPQRHIHLSNGNLHSGWSIKSRAQEPQKYLESPQTMTDPHDPMRRPKSKIGITKDVKLAVKFKMSAAQKSGIFKEETHRDVRNSHRKTMRTGPKNA